MKTRKNRKVAAAALSLGSAAVLLAGGTFAWYVVSNTAKGTVSGQAAKVENMEIGIKSAALAGTSGFTVDAAKTDVYWFDSYGPTTQNAFDAALTKVVEGKNADKFLSPVTSGAYTDGNAIKLYKNPTEAKPGLETVAEDSDYLTYTLTFKTVGGEKDIYFNRTMMNFGGIDGKTAGDKKILEALRIGVESDSAQTIFAPTRTAAAVTTDVGGVLDLNADGVYDYKVETAEGTTVNKEVYYGESVADPTYAKATTDLAEAVPASNTDSFNAKHVKTGENLYSYDTMTPTATAKTQQAHGMDYYTYFAADAAANHPIAKSDADGYAEVTIKIWLEGWDRSCTNDIVEKSVSCTLAFVSPDQDLNRN